MIANALRNIVPYTDKSNDGSLWFLRLKSMESNSGQEKFLEHEIAKDDQYDADTRFLPNTCR